MSRKGDTASRCIFGRFAMIYIPSRGDADIAILKALLLSSFKRRPAGQIAGNGPGMRLRANQSIPRRLTTTRMGLQEKLYDFSPSRSATFGAGSMSSGGRAPDRRHRQDNAQDLLLLLGIIV
jgi:hypothetical protein